MLCQAAASPLHTLSCACAQNAFYDWLGECGVASAYKNSITRLIVEKVYVLMPGMVDLSTFDE